MLLDAFDWLLGWLEWRKTLRGWRKQLRESPKLARCWRAVDGNPVIRPGYLSIEGELITIDHFYDRRVQNEPWYPTVREYLDRGWSEFAMFTIRYRVRDLKWKCFLVFYVNTLDGRLVGTSSYSQQHL